MGPPVLSAKEISKTLSAKKTAKKCSKSRNVLAWPQKFDDWPVMDMHADHELNKLLRRLLAPVRLPSNSLPLDIVKKVKGAERKEMRQELYASRTDDLSKTLRAKLFLGWNSVSRAVAKGNLVAAVLVAGNVQPQSLGKTVVDMCFKRDVPVIVMATLKETTRKCLGFGCLALGFKKSSSKSEGLHFQPLIKQVQKLAGTAQSCQHVKNVDDSKLVELEIPVKREVIAEQEVEGSVYRYRSSRKERAFVPLSDGKSDLAAWLAAEAETMKAEGNGEDFAEAAAGWGCSEVKKETLTSDNGGDYKTRDKSPGSGVKGATTNKRKAAGGNEDFISFSTECSTSNWPGIKTDVDCKSKNKVELQDFLAAEGIQEAVPTKKLATYRPLIVKNIQPNPNKKKKMKKSKTS